MRPRSALFDYQAAAAVTMVAKKKVACFLEPGLGKTAATLTALVDLNVKRTLVLAPARVAETVWHAEAQKWEHLRHLDVRPAVGNAAQRQRCIFSPSARVVTLSYENVPWLLGVCDPTTLFDAIVFDELSKMKHPGSSRFRKLRRYVPKFPVRIGLTGTPVGNHLLDIWGEMYMVADAAPLGPTYGEFQARYFAPQARVNNVVVSWRAFPTSQREIEARIRPYAFTLSPKNAPPMPVLNVNVVPVRLPPEVEEMSRELATDLTTKLANGQDLDTFNSVTAANKVRQMAGGSVYTNGRDGEWVAVHGKKLEALEELTAELQGEPLLVFYWYDHERQRILDHFRRAETLDSATAIEKWNRRETEILLAHPASAGHGLNLQAGGHNVAWYSLPYSLEMWKQANGRLRRTGQKSPYVNAHVLLAGKADEVVLAALHRKDAVESSLLEAMLA